VLVPDGTPTSLGSCIFALLAAGAIPSVEQGQAMLASRTAHFCRSPMRLPFTKRLFAHYRAVYFALGTSNAAPAALGVVLPDLKRIAAEVASIS